MYRLVGKPGFWLLWVVLIFGFCFARTGWDARKGLAELPIHGVVPEFILVDQAGSQFVASERLHGRIWVANFIFTRCPSVCPRLTQRMGEVQHRSRSLGDSFKIVSFSVDPEHDTPPVLAEFARKYRASRRVWSFVTGPRSVIHDTVVEGMKVAMGSEGSIEDPENVFHGTHVVLIDEKMRIRGYYDSEDDEGLDLLLRDAGLLANRMAFRGDSALPGAAPDPS